MAEKTVGDIPRQQLHKIFYDVKVERRDRLLAFGLLFPWEYWCDKCMRCHWDDSKIGGKHQEYGVGNFFVPVKPTP